ncbi:MAG: extracellular solute-binding protein, partial [Propionibacteriaceae bacterium]|nr:extracellular solute-binding protein [Propionibacteriaceae bacterium]
MKIQVRRGLVGAAVFALALTGCSQNTPSQPEDETQNTISILIGSSGQAETDAVRQAAAAWSAQSGVPTEVIAASDLNQEAAQGFASGQPADLLYVSTDNLAGWVANGSLEAYGDQLSNRADFYPGLREAFTVDGVFYAAPKDFSTLALVVNTDLWAEAGLTEADYPTTWAELTTVAQRLTTPERVGLSFGAELQRVGVFLAQNDGGVAVDGQATADSEANVEALTYVKDLIAS